MAAFEKGKYVVVVPNQSEVSVCVDDQIVTMTQKEEFGETDCIVVCGPENLGALINALTIIRGQL